MSAFNSFTLIDIVGCKLSYLKDSLYIFVVYIPPDVILADFISFIESLISYSLEFSNILILGDFNVSGFMSNATDSKSTLLHDMMASLNLTQLNSVSNTKGHFLDLVFSTFKRCVTTHDTCPLVVEDIHHPALNLELRIEKNASYANFPVCTDNNKIYNFKKANFPLLYNDLLNSNYEFLYQLIDVNQACEKYYNYLHSIFDKHVPLLKCKGFKFPSWYTKELKELIACKQKLYKKYKIDKSNQSYNNFALTRRAVKKLISRDYQAYINKAQESLLGDPKYFWTYIKTKKGRSSIPNEVHYDGCYFSKPSDIVNVFAKHFCSAFETPVSCNVPDFTHLQNNNLCINIDITENDVLKAIYNLKNSCVAGIDKIPSFLIKDCSAVFLKPLCYIFKLCIKNAIFPDIWKVAKITPVFKEGDFTNVEKYRPISILPNFSKVFETVLYNQLYPKLKNVISEQQHGFMPGRSTLSNLTCMSQSIAASLDNKGQLDVVYTDLSKAYDKLNHNILLHKLSAVGLSDHLTEFFATYLHGRKNFVVVNGYSSESYGANSGIPQGSTLGPFLFLIYFNDVVDTVQNSQILIYADDVKIYREIGCVEDCNKLQQDIDYFKNWCSDNSLKLNVAKCKVVTFTLCNNPFRQNYSIAGDILQRPSTVRDLGVLYDHQFSFREHIDNTVKKANNMLGFMVRNCKDFYNTQALVVLFNTLVRSRLEYCSLAWFPYYQYQINNLEKVQRRFLKYLYVKQERVWPERNVAQKLLLDKFHFNCLFSRRIMHAITFIYKLINNLVKCGEFLAQVKFHVPRINSRFAITLYVKTPRTNIGRKAPLYVISYYLNKIEKFGEFDIFNSKLRDIKTAVFQYYGGNTFNI
ncbi:hypothetical protein Zmor_026539 [Zophobas morio]|uniref:Reverse transcriptase domain-containing protein n=1 Tax=Zophobas morio TaxID=2755281 RepID=A0AA38M5K8_9CUCU|nr:hypothetical protein Zmor_026539 [Zophobas morio]